MADFNRVILMGRLTRDVELKYTPSGTAVTEIGLATSDRRKNQAGEWVEETVFVDVTLWGRTAEVASEYLSKGSTILIEGRLKYDTWESEGQKRSKLRVVGERMQMVGSRPGSAGPNAAKGRDSSSFDESEYTSRPTYDDLAPARSGGSAPSPPAAPPEDNLPF
jgi:single-strand DNA-binding protein